MRKRDDRTEKAGNYSGFDVDQAGNRFAFCRMEQKSVYPRLKAYDSESSTSYIYFDESVVLPDGSQADIALLFDKENSFEEMQELISILNQKRMKFVITSPK